MNVPKIYVESTRYPLALFSLINVYGIKRTDNSDKT